MVGLNVSFPFALCQDIVQHQDDQQCHVYQASISVGDGTKAIGSLLAHVISSNSSEADRMVEFDVSENCLPIVSLFDKENRIRFRVESLHKVLQADGCSVDCGEEKGYPPGSNTADDIIKTKLTEQAFDHQCSENRTINPPNQYREKSRQNEAVEEQIYSDQSAKVLNMENSVHSVKTDSAEPNASSSDHGYSLTVGLLSETQQIPQTITLSKQTTKTQKRSTNKYDELIWKLKQPIESLKVADSLGLIAQNDSSTKSIPPTNSDLHDSLPEFSIESLAQNTDVSSGETGEKEDSTATREEPAGLADSPPSIPGRFVRKYDRLIRNLEMASERSGLEMLSVLSGHSYKLDHDAKLGKQKGIGVATPDMFLKSQSTNSSGVKQNQNGQEHGFAPETVSVRDQILLEKKNLKKSMVSSSNKPNSKSTGTLNSQTTSRQMLPHMTSFPRKFPSSLIRTYMNVCSAGSKAGQSRKRYASSSETSLSKYRKVDEVGQLCYTDSEIGRKNMDEQAESAMDLSNSKVPEQNPEISSQAPKTVVVAVTSYDDSLSGKTEVPMRPCDMLGGSEVAQGPVHYVMMHPPPLPGHHTLAGTSSSFKGRNALTGEPPKIDHDYTDLVYDKYTPSCRALKTLVRPISMTQHINARVERVEQGVRGNSLVTISGHNRKAARGFHPTILLNPVLRVSQEGMPVVETLEDALTDTIRCREKQQDSYRKAIQAQSCQPLVADASDVPVLKEVVITPARRRHATLLRPCKPKAGASKTKAKPPAPKHHRNLSSANDASAQNMISLMHEEAENGKGMVSDPVLYTMAKKSDSVEDGTDGLSQEHLNQVLMDDSFLTGEQTSGVKDSACSELERDTVVGTNSETLERDTSSDSNNEAGKQYITINEEKDVTEHLVTTEQDVVIDNEDEATTTHYRPSTNVCKYCLKICHSPSMLCKHVSTVHSMYAVSPHHNRYLKMLKKNCHVLCPLCPNPTLHCNEYHLRAHLVGHHGKTKADLVPSAASVPAAVVCEVCQIHFLTVKEMEVHARLMHNCHVVICPHCPLLFVTEDARGKHMAAAHADDSGQACLCPLCGLAFESKEDLRSHKQEHRRGPRLPDSVRDSVPTSPTPSISSPPRPRILRSLWMTKRPRGHQRYAALESTDSAQLLPHGQPVHQGPTITDCMFCGMGFRDVEAMSSHLKIHLPDFSTSDKPTSLQCPYCPQSASFTTPAHLVSHLLDKHPEHFPNSCSLCSQSFVAEMPLLAHLKQSHGLDVSDFSGSPSASDSAAEGILDSDRLQASCSESSSSVASASEGMTEKPDAASVLQYLPGEAQTLIHQIVQRGKRAVVTACLQKSAERKIIFTPRSSPTAAEVAQPASQPVSLLAAPEERLGTEHFPFATEDQAASTAVKDEFAAEYLGDGFYLPGQGDTTTQMENTNSADSHWVMYNPDFGITLNSYEEVQNADEPPRNSDSMADCGSMNPSGAQTAEEGCGAPPAEQATPGHEAAGEAQVLMMEEMAMMENVPQSSDVMTDGRMWGAPL